jgi:predicted NBD/HSP70 family sugar kinase
MARTTPQQSINHILENEAQTLVRILEQIRREGPISQVEVGNKLGLGRAAISVHVKKLIAQGIVVPTGDLIRGEGSGRPRTLLDLARDGKAVLGMSLDMPYLSGAIMDFSDQIVAREQLDVSEVRSAEELAPIVERFARKLMAQAKASKLEIFSACFSVPGVIEDGTGRILNYLNMPAANGLDVKKVLGRLLDVPVYVTSLGAAVYWGGLEADQDDCQIYHIIWDLGVGVMFGQGYKIGFREYSHTPGQISRNLRDIGHAVLWPGGRKCYCGRRGCLEAYLGGRAINDRWHARQGTRKQPFVNLLEKAKDPRSAEFRLITRNARRLGEMLGWIFSVYRPRHVRLSGQIADAVPIACDAFWDGVCRRLGEVPADMQFNYAGDVRTIGILGSCRLALHVHFNRPLLENVCGDIELPVNPSTIVVG